MGKVWEGHTLPIQNNTGLICPPPLFPNNYGVISQHGNKRLFLKFISFSFEDGNLQPPLCPLEQNSWLRLNATPEKKGNQNYCDLSALLFYHHQLLCWTTCTKGCVKKADEASETGSQAIKELWTLDETSLVLMAQIQLSGHSQAINKNIKFQI